MRFMYLVLTADDAAPPPPRLMEEMGKLSAKAGAAMLGGGGLAPTALAARVRLKDGKLLVTDGPFTETKEVVAGYAIFEYPTREAALQSAVEFMELHRLYGEGWEGACEMRPMLDGPPGG